MGKTYEYITVDVFTDRAFAGNPLAVVTDARGLTADQMQAIAAEFHYSESTFVFPPIDGAHTANVRIFTPTTEVPFAGHPNIGTAFALARQAERKGETFGETLVFEEAAGIVPVEVLRDSRGSVAGARLTAPEPLTLGERIPAVLVAECIEVEPAAIVTARHEPVIASVGLPFVITEVTVDAIGRARPNAGRFARAAERFPSSLHRFSVFLYARTAGHAEGADVRARMFAPLSGVAEDPATGSANGALGGLLATLAPEADATVAFDVLQGAEMGRPSLLSVTAEKERGVVTRVRVAGSCVVMMEGTLNT